MVGSSRRDCKLQFDGDSGRFSSSIRLVRVPKDSTFVFFVIMHQLDDHRLQRSNRPRIPSIPSNDSSTPK